MADAYDFWAERIAPSDSAAIDRFWNRFAGIAPVLDGTFNGTAEPVDVAGCVNDALGDLADQITSWEFGAGENGGHHLALSPELNHAVRPLARALVNRALDLEGWSFSDARPPEPFSEHTLALIEGRARSDFALTGITPSAGEHQRIDFVGVGTDDADFLGGLACLTFSVLFGEAIERDWLGESVGNRRGLLSAFSRAPAPDACLPTFAKNTQAMLDDLIAARPTQPRASVFSDQAAVTLFDAKPRSDDTDPRSDIFSYNTCHPDIAQARFARARISSVRFSRFGECLCGIRIPRNEAHTFDNVGDRGDLAETIHGVLAIDGTGGLIGEGHGLGHVYIDFATTDITSAVARVEAELGKAGISSPCHLLFDEAGLEEKMLPLTSAAHHH